MNDELAHYAPLRLFNETKADLGRALGMIQVLRTEMKIYKEQFDAETLNRTLTKDTLAVNARINGAASPAKKKLAKKSTLAIDEEKSSIPSHSILGPHLDEKTHGDQAG